MPRTARVILPGYPHHIVQRGHNGRVVFAEPRDYIPGAEVESTYTYDWVLDPYSRGTYCSYKPGWMGKYYAHFQQDRGRVFFGSGDHGEGWRGFIDGAIGAGIKAAERVRQELG